MYDWTGHEGYGELCVWVCTIVCAVVLSSLVVFICTYIKRLSCLSGELKVIMLMSVAGLWEMYRTVMYKGYVDLKELGLCAYVDVFGNSVCISCVLGPH